MGLMMDISSYGRCKANANREAGGIYSQLCIWSQTRGKATCLGSARLLSLGAKDSYWGKMFAHL
jgi:hypothetical protein